MIGVDDALATSSPGVFAAGDVTGLVEGEHADVVMGRIAATNAVHAARHAGRALGRSLGLTLGLPLPRRVLAPSTLPARWEAQAAPVIIETEPLVVRVGATLADAQANPAWDDVRAHDSDRGLDGHLRLVTARPQTGRRGSGASVRIVVGATLFGPAALEDVAMPALAVRAGVPVDRLLTLALPARTAARAVVELLSDAPADSPADATV
jgi:pyruvate/2-oxoglutarate dehydrogenase complex dihydrolipoamide dehydrogenase (E3) component